MTEQGAADNPPVKPPVVDNRACKECMYWEWRMSGYDGMEAPTQSARDWVDATFQGRVWEAGLSCHTHIQRPEGWRPPNRMFLFDLEMLVSALPIEQHKEVLERMAGITEV